MFVLLSSTVLHTSLHAVFQARKGGLPSLPLSLRHYLSTSILKALLGVCPAPGTGWQRIERGGKNCWFQMNKTRSPPPFGTTRHVSKDILTLYPCFFFSFFCRILVWFEVSLFVHQIGPLCRGRGHRRGDQEKKNHSRSRCNRR